MQETAETRPLSDAQILEIMHTHDGFRRGCEGVMSDAEFIDLFRKIVPKGSVSDTYGFVTTQQIADIHNLRLQYECTPRSTNGFLPHYTAKSVRLQKGKQFEWIPDQTMYSILGYEVKRSSYAWLDDVLKVQLLRWGFEKRKTATPKRPVGRQRTRPRDENDKVIRSKRKLAQLAQSQ